MENMLFTSVGTITFLVILVTCELNSKSKHRIIRIPLNVLVHDPALVNALFMQINNLNFLGDELKNRQISISISHLEKRYCVFATYFAWKKFIIEKGGINSLFGNLV
jgi:hypothetical protein